MSDTFRHIADELNDNKTVVFTAQSAKNFHLRMLICRHAFKKGVVPVNPFTNFGYFLNELVDRKLVRAANNVLLNKTDELWVYGDVSNGVLSEIKRAKQLNKPMRFFDISKLPETIKEVDLSDLPFEKDVREYRQDIIKLLSD